MVRVLVVGSEHKIGVWKSLIGMTNGVSLVHSLGGLTQDERKEDNIHEYPLHVPLKKWLALDQNIPSRIPSRFFQFQLIQ